MSKEIARMALPPHLRVNLKNQIRERLQFLGKSFVDIDCPLTENADVQPSIAEMIILASTLNCVLEFTEVRLVPQETAQAYE